MTILSLQYESYYVWYASLLQGYTADAGYTQKSCSHEGTRHILSEQCHLVVLGKTKTNNIPAPQVYNLRERSCSFVPLTRQRNIASISRGITLLNQAPGDRSIGRLLTMVIGLCLVVCGGLLRHSPGRFVTSHHRRAPNRWLAGSV